MCSLPTAQDTLIILVEDLHLHYYHVKLILDKEDLGISEFRMLY